MCPDCGSLQLVGEAYDYGVCPETGYRDAGDGFRCLDCGARGPAEDVLENAPAPRIAAQSERGGARRKEVA